MVTEILKEQAMAAADWERVGAALRGGGLVALPSDTVYGLACLATISEAVERIYDVKGRDRQKPVALVFTAVEQIGALIPDLPPEIRSALAGIMPGPVTAIVPFGEGAGGIHVRGGGSIGVRIIAPPEGDLYRFLPGPLAVTSANLSGHEDPGVATDIPPEVSEACDFVIDSGRRGSCIPSTVVDLRPLTAGKTPEILREGTLDYHEIVRCCEQKQK